MLRGIKKKVSTLWQKRKTSRRTSIPPSSSHSSSTSLAESETETSVVPNSTPDDSTVSENPPLPPRPIPSIISTDLEHEQRPLQQSPPSRPSTVSALSDDQHDRPVVQETVNDPPTPEQDPYMIKYVPYTDVNPLKNNMFARTAGIYGRVNPDIMGGFGNDDDSIWLVDDEEEEGSNQDQNVSGSRLESPADSTSRLALLGQRYERAAHSATRLQQASAAAAAAPSAEPAFRYQRPAFLDNDDDLTSGSLVGTEEAGEFRTCLDCIQLSIESDLSSKLWTEIRCPECTELLEYADIQRYANEQTFSKYETIALRAAMSEADNFVWCTSGCGSGQIHESGTAQPIVTCLHCNHRSCFHHNVAWHENLSCEEYDQLLADPENFRSRLELENERWSEEQQAQLEADRAMAQNLLAEDQAVMRQREERAHREREQAQKAAQLARQIAARRKKEEAKSSATVSRTTKPCAGCGWAIEKNRGCSHMTCIRCKHEFCFECGASHRDILRSDNSVHKKTCPYHPNNLPTIDGARR
ncbi:ring finger domain-containing protein [Fusarium flagelliforme]|uniref:RBR-type E3 ubiquitin transferase n=1 Tax=Fusarium flagelliforme TaxID=2675880 RepID=A0A395MUI2_9HYPO|nr:ring finger domain-containing protein [Fusarium flagelliforme]